MKKLLLAIFLWTLAGAAVAAAWLAPAWLDVERYRPQITAALADTLGREVAIDGRLEVALLPRPQVTLRGIRTTGEPSALLEVDAVRATLDPLAMLRGEAAVARFELQRPVLSAAALARDAAGWARRGAQGEGLRHIVVQDGVITRNDEDRTGLLTGLMLEIEAAAVGAPYRMKGEAEWRGAPLAFDGALGLPTATATPVSLAVRMRDAKAEARLSGQLGGQVLRGRLALSGDDFNGLLRRLEAGMVLPPAGKRDFALQANIELDGDGDRIRLDGLDGRIGDSRATGSVAVDLGDAPLGRLILSFASLNLDQWLAGAPGPAGPARWRALLDGLPLTLDISADALVVRQAVLRQVRLDARVADGIARIGQAVALMPGNSTAIASGEIDFSGAAPHGDISFEASSDNLRDVLNWLGLPVAQVPADRLRVLAVSGRLAGTPQELRLSDLDLRVDTLQVAGAMTLRHGGARPALALNLTAPSLNLDAYWRKESGPPDTAGLRTLAGALDANIRLNIGQMTVRDVPLRDVRLDGALVAGTVTLRQASAADLGGAAVSLSGTVGGLDGTMPQLRGLRFEIAGAEPDKLTRLLDIPLPLPAERLGRVAARGQLDGDGRRLSLDAALEAAGGRLNLAGNVSDLATSPYWDLQLSARHEDLTALLRLAQPDYRPAGALGAFSLRTALSGTAAELAAADLRLALGPVTLDGLAYLSLAGKPVVTASLTGSAIDLTPFLPAATPAAAVRGWSKDAFDLGWLRDLDASLALDAPALAYDRQKLERPQLRLVVEDGVLRLEHLHAAVGDGRMAARGRLGADGAAELRLELVEARPAVPLLRLGAVEVTGGRTNAVLQLATEGRSPFEMVSRLSGSAQIDVRDGALSGLTLGEVSQKLPAVARAAEVPALLQAGMTRGRTPFSRLSGRFAVKDGVVGSDDLSLEAEGGAATGVLTAGLSAGTMDARLVFRLTDQPQAPGFVMAMEGPIDRPRRSFEAADLEAWVMRRDAVRLLEEVQAPASADTILERAVDQLSQ